MENIIQVKRLKKSFGATEVLKGIDFSVEKGALFAFLGTNGAGKSTAISILSTLQQQFEGELLIDQWKVGKDNAEIRKSIGVVFQNNLLDERLTVKENIILKGGLYQLGKRQLKGNYRFLSEFFHLEEIEHKRYGVLSGGQRRRADITRSMIHLPKILFLDEPTTGLDPETRVSVWKTIKKLQIETGMTIFLTTHYMEEAARANHIVVLHEGEIIAEGTPESLKQAYAADTLTMIGGDCNEIVAILRENHHRFQQQGEEFTIHLQNTMEAYSILRLLESYVSSFEVRKASMEDVFMKIVDQQRGIV